MIECIPNFSDGRRREVIDAIAAAIASVRGAVVLDIHADADHNRSVITFAGPADAVAEAAFQAVCTAAASIDMNQHRGQHPRIGATDVLPFVPLAGSTLEHCVALARAVGRRIGEELGIPVYLYEAAATRPDRIALPNLRRGEYEGLREAIERDPERAPDFGPARLGPAGATVVGARMPLIAFNIYLNSADVQIAKRVAKAVRGSSGGLRGVRALGLLVDGRAQVSMNLIDYQGTPLHRAFELVAREAAAYGVSIVESELVGLIPEDALIDAARHYLRLHVMHKGQILERRLAQATADDQRPTIDSHRPSLVVGGWSLVDSEQERAMESDLQQTIAALGDAAGQLAESVPGAARSGLMLQALGRELRELAAQPAQASPRAIARAMLLAAERAAKVAEVAAGLRETGDQQIQTAATSAIQMAQALAVNAQARATALLPQLADQELRDNFAHEFAAHTSQTEALAARSGPAT
ncbi:MAG TPA: glutamate formimidoyltransferase [Roseiflexaceae bacterium]|nr:glutamate formimidoyltransferase [Roseiflexaceae bacterium]